jgi:hypothetical protein
MTSARYQTDRPVRTEVASALLIVEDFEIDMVNSGLLPDLVGIPLIVQDKGFVPENILTQDPNWQWGKPG